MDSRERIESEEVGEAGLAGKAGVAGKWGRREFIGAAAAALFAGVVIQITGCSTDDKEEAAPAGSATGSISDNHGHTAVVTKTVIDAGAAVLVTIQGSAGHTHSLALTVDEMATLKAKGHVMKETTERSDATATDTHKHMVMFN